MDAPISPLVALAHTAVTEYVLHGEHMTAPTDDALPQEILRGRVGTFVSIHKKNGDLRGCIGTFLPVRANVAEEVIENAIPPCFA